MAEGEDGRTNLAEKGLKSGTGNEIEAEASAAANGEKSAEKEEEIKAMKPWEQHAAVISIPRFDYNAPSALLNQSHSGFLITCSIKREKSATKEAIAILEKYIRSHNCKTSENSESFNEDERIKRRKTLSEENDNEDLKSNGASENTDGNSKEADRAEGTGSVLSLVKLTRSGLLLLTFAGEKAPDTIDIVSDIFQCLESGNLKSPLWCHRIFPIQTTCKLEEKELHSVVSKLVLRFVNNKQEKPANPVKFAVGYNRRGLEEAQGKAKNTPGEANTCPLLDRNKCFEIVASAVKAVVSDSAVDLTCPELSVLVELLPLSGVPNGSLVAAVSVLPLNLVSVKPRLCIKPLVSDASSKNTRR